jgi:transposase
MLPILLADLAVPRLGAGRPRTRPACLIADKAYSSRAHRALLRRRGIRAVIPEPADQSGHRRRRGRRGGRPISYDAALYRHRNVIERGFNAFNNGAAWPAATTSSPSTTAGGAVLRAIVIWLNDLCDTP